MMTRPFVLCCCGLAGAILALAGCKSSGGGGGIQATSSGLPEIMLRAKTHDEVKRVAGEFFLDRGYVETRSQHVYEMVFDKPTKNGRSRRALRVRLRMHKQTDDSWRLVGTPLGVEGWRTDLESETVLLEGASQIQAFLLEIKQRVESAR
jgi:hypothetical protein